MRKFLPQVVLSLVSLTLGLLGGVLFERIRPKPLPKLVSAPELRERVKVAARDGGPNTYEALVGFRDYSSLRSKDLDFRTFLTLSGFVPEGEWASGWSYEGTEGIVLWVEPDEGLDVVGIRWTKERKGILFSGRFTGR
jgi:hypothetical protein